MANPTTNFGWVMPTSSSLVTNLPADFNTFGQAVDTSMAQLKGGTTGQILSKTSATDMAFTWITNDVGDITAVNTTAPLAGGGTSGALTLSIASATTAVVGAVQLSDSTSTTSSVLAATPTAVKSSYDLAAAAIPKSTITTNGDLIYGTGSGTVSRLGIGTSGQVLSVSSGVPTWATPAASASGLTLITAQTIGTGVSSVAVTGVFSSTYENYKIIFSGGTSSVDPNIGLKLGSTTTGYYAGYARIEYAGAAGSFASDNNGASFARVGASNTNGMVGNCDLLCPNLAKNTFIIGSQVGASTGSSGGGFAGFLNDTTAYTGFTITPSSGTLTGGTIRVYGYQNS